MTPDQNQYLPNDQTLQINYKPNPRVLDHRGQWTEILSERLKLSEWGITDNKVELYDKPKTEQAYVAFNKCGLTRLDQLSANSFPDRASEFTKSVFSLDAFDSPVHVQRIAVKSRFCTAYSGTFEDLVKRVQDRYVNVTERAYAAIGKEASLIDIGAPVNFKDKHGQFDTHCGPMKAEQSAQPAFFFYKEKGQLPEVGLYYDIDYSFCPEEPVTVDEVVAKAVVLASEGWARHQRIRKLIVET